MPSGNRHEAKAWPVLLRALPLAELGSETSTPEYRSVKGGKQSHEEMNSFYNFMDALDSLVDKYWMEIHLFMWLGVIGILILGMIGWRKENKRD